MTKIIACSNPDNLLAALFEIDDTFAVVEAEYGDREVYGHVDGEPDDLLTLNHHIRPHKSCPCNVDYTFGEGVPAVGVSHFDLDTLGGVLQVLGQKPQDWEFWDLAAYLDTNGPHKIDAANPSPRLRAAMDAFWAWSDANRLVVTPNAVDVTDFFARAGGAIRLILAGDPTLIDAGRAWRISRDSLERDSFQLDLGRVVFRADLNGDRFTNMFYEHNGKEYDFIVAWKSGMQNVACSAREKNLTLADGSPFDAAEIMRQVTNDPGAGGHKWVAGTNRAMKYSYEDAEAIAKAIAEIVN